MNIIAVFTVTKFNFMFILHIMQYNIAITGIWNPWVGK